MVFSRELLEEPIEQRYGASLVFRRCEGTRIIARDRKDNLYSYDTTHAEGIDLSTLAGVESSVIARHAMAWFMENRNALLFNLIV
jgi:hypothetical protein